MGLDVTNAAGRLATDASSSGDEPKPTSSSSSFVQAAAQQVLQKQFTQAQQSTGVTLPSFYNPAAVNPLRVAQQMQKRKLLWSHKEKEPTATTAAKLWESTAFSQDQDGKMTAKFKRLMGIKSDTSNAAGEELSESDVLKKQKELFASLDQQYAVARAATHTQRGLGLGFSSNPR
uniref:EOG090X0LFN n=1 Tax=Moina brachiata TaxID=675436 RepID=A0A4Y7NLF4_9CRUS|nr:EOG090X0LFN [Moina brachiata]SVE93407.1 EOG090X0LFN [Moina brachiata]